MPSSHLILGRPLLLLPSVFPSIRVFSNESALMWMVHTCPFSLHAVMRNAFDAHGLENDGETSGVLVILNISGSVIILWLKSSEISQVDEEQNAFPKSPLAVEQERCLEKESAVTANLACILRPGSWWSGCPQGPDNVKISQLSHRVRCNLSCSYWMEQLTSWSCIPSTTTLDFKAFWSI